MNTKQILVVGVAILLALVFVIIAIQDIVKTQDQLKLQEVELKSRSAEIHELNIDYEQLNEKLDTTSEKKKRDEAEVKKLQEEKKRLEQEKLRLEQQVSVLRENTLASASTKVINAATLTQTANATALQQGGSVSAIVRSAAIRHGLDPNWFESLAMCESTMDPNAVNYNYAETDSNGNRYYPSGLFQHITRYWPARAAEHGYAGASVFNAEANANVTAAMWKSGSHLWECQ